MVSGTHEYIEVEPSQLGNTTKSAILMKAKVMIFVL